MSLKSCLKFANIILFSSIFLKSYWRLFCADLDSKSVATWLPSIYYNRQQHLLKTVMEKTGTTGTALEDDSLQLSDSQRKRKRSIWSKQKGLRRGSYDVQSSRSDSLLTGIIDRKASTSSILDHDFFGEIACKWFLKNLTSAHNMNHI